MSGGKTQTASQQVQIPPEVMARYNAVNTRAETAASKPFQAYSQDPNAFVAPLTQTQQAGIQNINQAAGMTQPYFNTAAGLTMGGAQGVGALTPEQIQAYQNPYTQSVVDATRAGLQQQQGQQLAQQQSEAIKAGAFGGDRAGIQRAMLQGQQGLATAQAISPLYQQAYQNAVQTAMGQQGVRAQDLQRQLAAGQQLGGLGAQAQQSALAGAQAQLAAGTAEQQTQQAGLQALYNQFLQERGYDFQTAQFLANIAMGTGALSGSTTTTNQMAPFFSDEREKTNVQPLGEGMYAYDYKDDVRRAKEEGRPMPPKRVGPMAQDIEERAPGLVSEVGGNKVVGRLERAGGGAAGKGSVQAPSYGPPTQMGMGAMSGSTTSTGTPSPGLVAGDPNAASSGFQSFQSAQNAGMGGQLPPTGQAGPVQVPSEVMARYNAVNARANAPSQSAMSAGSNPQQANAGKGGVQAPSYGPPPPMGIGSLPGPLQAAAQATSSPTGSPVASAAQSLGAMGGPSLGGKTSVQPGQFPTQASLSGGTSTSMPVRRGMGKGGVQAPAYASGGSVVGSEDMKAILAAIGQPLAFYGGKEMYGGAGKGGVGAAGYVSPASIAVPKLVTAGNLPSARPSGFEQAVDTGTKIAGLAKTGKEAYTGAQKFVSGLGGGQSGPSREAPSPPKGSDPVAESMPPAEWDTNRLFGYRGGLMRDHYAGGGALPYSTGDVGEDPLQKIGEEENQKRELAKPGNLPQVGAGAGDKLLDLGMKAAMMFAASDARVKDNIEQVGELYDGQPVYRYNMKGSPKTQIGLMAQDLERNGHEDAVAGLGGLKMVDYKRATDVAAGLAPRRGYEDGGTIRFEDLDPPMPPRDERKYTPEALRGLVREYGQELRGRRPNFDPAFAERVFQGESGFDPRAVGDDGSSFGVPQLHMGNISPKFPRPGLGDEFMRDTGLDPRDPSNARAMTAWAMDHAAEKGWQPWTVADKLTRQGDAGGAPAPGLGGARRETTERVTPGLAGPGRGPMDPASAPFYTLTRALRGKEGEESPVGKALTSENFWIPALSGIGSMLASRSPFLGVALGEGLVGGTKAYTDLQGQQQQMGESRAKTEAQMADISQKSFFEYAGRGMVRYLKPDGSYGTMGFADYFSLPRDKRPPVDPRFKDYLEQIEPTFTKGKADTTTGGTSTSQPAGGVTSGQPEPSTERPSGVPTTVELSPQERTQSFETARQIALEGRSTLEERRKNDFFQPQRALATASQGVTQNTLKLASDILSLPTGQSLATSGKFTNAIGPYVAAMNNFVEVITGRPGAVISPGILGTQESIDKEIKKLQAQVTSDNGQRAVAALEEMAKTLVSLGNSKEGQRLILAKVLTDSQRNIDKDGWFAQWIDAGSTAPGGERGAFSDFARLSGQEANREFDRRYGEAFYADDRKNLGKMMDDKVEGTRTVGGQPMTVFEYVRANAAQLPADHILQIAEDYGPNTLRYFGIDPNRVQQIRQQMRSTRG